MASSDASDASDSVSLRPSPSAVPDDLDADDLVRLVERVFAPGDDDERLTLLVDLPGPRRGDRPAWAERRALAARWRDLLTERSGDLGLEIELVQYENVGTNNGDLPELGWTCPPGEAVADGVDDLDPAAAEPLDALLARTDLILAPTELSATAPLKLGARRHGFRAATMPGFSAAMVPALAIDYREVDRRVRHLADLLDRAEGVEIFFRVHGALAGERPDDGRHDGRRDGRRGEGRPCRLHLDLRHRRGHASGGLLLEPGTAGNLPSGESYIVPYEGEREDDPSRSEGLLPVELPVDEELAATGGVLGDGVEREVVVYRIEGNRAVGVEPGGPVAEREAERLAAEPAYANLAELGLGVLADFGLAPIGEILLDEKLGLHIAFGRSDHFGGTVGPEDFSSPEAVVHIDRVYLPQIQPRVTVERAILRLAAADPDAAAAVGLEEADPSRPKDLEMIHGGAWVPGFFA